MLKHIKKDMTKNIKSKDMMFKIGVIVAVLLFSALIYFSVNYEIHSVQKDFFTDTQFIPPNQALEYKTEFCANKLTELIQEAHFFEEDISTGEQIISENEQLSNKEEKVISTEEKELTEIKQEFNNY